jgi:EmrB/QacA subfamily drug resistance transporter
MKSATSRWWALAALALAMLTIGLDTTVLTVAMPTLATDLGATTSQLQWFSSAYTLVLAATLLPAGALGDRYGHRRLLLGALLLFGAASVLCAYAGSASGLIAARAVLGLGAAIMMPLSMAVLPVLFTDAAERARALTIWVTSTAIGLPLGPILGGWLLTHFWWGSIFLINVPLVILGVIAVAIFVPASRSDRPTPLDLVGVALSSLGLLGLTYGFIQAGQDGWGNAEALLTIVTGLLLLAGFVAWQRRVVHPLIDLALFRSRGFTWGTIFATAVNFALFGVLFAVPQFLQAVGEASALGTGVRLLPMIGGLLVGTRLADQLARRLGTGPVLAVGFVLLTAGLALGATTGTDSAYWHTGSWIALVGVGMGVALPTAMNAALGALSTERSGSGSALIQALRQAGGTIGVAVLGTILSSGYRSGLGDAVRLPVTDSVTAGVAVAQRLGQPELLATVRSAFVRGMDSMLWTCAGICVVAVIAALVVLPRRRPAAQPQPDRPESVHVV